MEKSDNELIAQFMGSEEKPMDDSARKNSIYLPDWTMDSSTGKWFRDYKDIPFHKSWDWLMPVVEKIETIKHIGIDAIYIQIKGNTCQIWTYFDVKEFLRLTGDDKNDGNKFKVGHTAKTKIEAVYHAVVDFIKWYNSQSPATIK